MAQIGCGGLGVAGKGGDSVIRIPENISQFVTFPLAEGLIQNITESVSVIVT
jgi:hypothetical protein